jgi:hypothetical protein
LPKLILRMLLCSVISLAAYGAVLGASNGWLQALVSTVKLPMLFLVTLAICLPTLYLFNLVFGARLSVLQACLTALVGLRFLTSGMRALNRHFVVESAFANQVVVPAQQRQRELVSAKVGGAAELANHAPTNGAEPAPSRDQNVAPEPAAGDRPASMLLLYIWILLFGFVGTQLAWTLRPFFGSPGKPFELFRDLEGTFYSDIFSTLGTLFG